MPRCHFAPAAPAESVVYGACRPGYGDEVVADETVAEWIESMQGNGIERVCCLLDDEQLASYDDLLGTYRAAFGWANVVHAPIPDFEAVDSATYHETILPFLRESVDQDAPVVVHCSAGLGRTGQVLARWLVDGRGYDLEAAVETVREQGRRPLEAVSRDDLRGI